MSNYNTALIEQQNLLVVRNDDYTSDIICETERKKYAEILKTTHNCKFENAIWEIEETFRDIPGKINFDKLEFLTLEELSVVKCFIVNKLVPNAERTTSLNNQISELKNFFVFLRSENIKLKDFNESFYKQFLKSNPKANIAPFIRFLNEENILDVEVQKVTHRKSKQRSAVEQSVIEQLDIYFFNLDGKNEIPTDMRSLYLLLRFVCNRISEVLNMDIDCIRDVDDNYFSIIIPNTKNTAHHKKEYVNYYISNKGDAEKILRQAVEAQIKYASDNKQGNRLFVSTQQPNLILKDYKFNDYIAAVCEKENICTSDGNIAAPTSHQFRHNAVTERIDSGLYSRKMLKQELNHNNIDSQLTYYGKSAYDRLVEDKGIIGSVYNENAVNTVFDGRNKQTNEVKIIPKFQYDKLFKSPSIRFLPEGQLCSACSCKPLFESCVTCDNFVPDPKYYEDVLNIVILLEAKLEQIKKAGNNKPAEKIIKEQIDVYNLYLKKVGNINEKEQ